MDKKVLIGGVVGGVVIFVFSFGLLLFFGEFLIELKPSTTNLVVSLVIFLIAPVGGGFLAGRLCKPKPRMAGLIAGTLAGMMILAAFLLVFGFSFQTLLTGSVIVFVWVILGRISAGLSRKY
jgi:hypothetical protein